MANKTADIAAYRRQYYQQHKASLQAYAKMYHTEHAVYFQEYYQQHKAYFQEYQKGYRLLHPSTKHPRITYSPAERKQRVAAVARRCGLTRRQKQKAQIIAMYGGCCAYCGAREPALLQLDHVNDDGHIERRTHGFKYHLLLRQPRRSDLQLLCAACNDRKRFYGPDLGTWAAKQIAAEQGIITYRTPTTKDNIRNRRPRATVIALYGGYCVGCGSKEATILQIDHIQRIGRKARRLRKENGRQFFPRLLKQPVRSDLRLLCTNCNTRAKYYGQDICDWIEPMVSGA